MRTEGDSSLGGQCAKDVPFRIYKGLGWSKSCYRPIILEQGDTKCLHSGRKTDPNGHGGAQKRGRRGCRTRSGSNRLVIRIDVAVDPVSRKKHRVEDSRKPNADQNPAHSGHGQEWLWYVSGGRTAGEVEGVSREHRKDNSHCELSVEVHGPDIALVEFEQPRRQNHRQCEGEHVPS